MRNVTPSVAAFLAATCLASPALAQSAETLEERVALLERQNQELRARLDAYDQIQRPHAPARASPSEQAGSGASARPAIGVSPGYGFQILDHAENTQNRALLQLRGRQNGDLDAMVTVSGAVTAVVNAQWSDTDNKFGYLMRNPTSANQLGTSVSEAVVHSAQLAITAQPMDGVTLYAEMLYAPSQSFGTGTITSLERNTVSVRRAWLMLGDLDRSPVYALVGKLDAPFGLGDTVSPFTNSTTWHAFAPLAYGAQIGYAGDRWSARFMAIQGGAQFRGANAPVEDSGVPSRINNFSLDVNYRQPIGADGYVAVGGSYLHGSAYCQGYPVFHFFPCNDVVPAFALYTEGRFGGFEYIAEYNQTTDVWPGTQVPAADLRNPAATTPPQRVWTINPNPLSQFAASDVTSWTLGARYGFDPQSFGRSQFLSAEFSTFISGPEGSPWERQHQFVAGYSRYVAENVNLFGEYVHVNGFAPLNFVSGGNFADGSTWSDQGVQTNVVLTGLQVAF